MISGMKYSNRFDEMLENYWPTSVVRSAFLVDLNLPQYGIRYGESTPLPPGSSRTQSGHRFELFKNFEGW